MAKCGAGATASAPKVIGQAKPIRTLVGPTTHGFGKKPPGRKLGGGR